LLQARAINLSIHSLSTFSNRKLLFETRHTAFKDKKFESVWTFAGKIYARKNENAVKIRIRNQRDIVTKIEMSMEHGESYKSLKCLTALNGL
jgi:hypothetical protein